MELFNLLESFNRLLAANSFKSKKAADAFLDSNVLNQRSDALLCGHYNFGFVLMVELRHHSAESKKIFDSASSAPLRCKASAV